MKYYLVAGEASGDLHGANLMKELKKRDAQATFRFFGGGLMQAEGGELVKHYADMAFMGYIEVIFNLTTILKNIRLCREDIAAWKPDVLVLIDFPGFNLKIAAFAKAKEFLVCYYISPKVWAWNQKRVLKIKKSVDHLFCILPFEVDFYKGWGMKVDYVGNPILDAVAGFNPDNDFLKKYKLEGKKIIALLPGSRRQEISRLLPVMLLAAKNFSDYQLVVAGAPSFGAAYYEQFFGQIHPLVLFDETYNILSNAMAAIVTSGTATLETALFNVPQVVVYKGHPISIAIGKLIIKLKFISLVNLIINKLVVKELIQEKSSPENIALELDQLLNNETYRNRMLSGYDELDRAMGKPGASAKVAALIIGYTKNK